MTYQFRKMNQLEAEEIAYNWHYDGLYSFYDMENDQDDLEEFLNKELRKDHYFACNNNNEMIGFFSFERLDEETIEIGLGLKPDLTSNGLGLEFIKAGIEYAQVKYHPKKLTLAVASFNDRAIKVYLKAGFTIDNLYVQETNGSHYEFVRMSLQLNNDY